MSSTSTQTPDDTSGHFTMCGCPDCAAAHNGGLKIDGYSGFSQPQADFQPPPIQPASAAAAGTFTAGAQTAPTYAIDALINEYDYQWGSTTPGTAAVVTYSFLTSVPSYYGSGAGERNNFVAMNAAQKQAARDAFANYADVANIQFVEVAAGTGSINLGTANLGSGIGGWAYYPYPGYAGSNDQSAFGDVWITNLYSSYNNPTKGSWEYQTYIHEIGHAIGMKHPGNYNAGGGGTGGPYLPTAEDNHQYSVMSYYSGPTYNGTEPITPQLYDVATIQYLYGVNTSTRSGDDTYTFATSLQVKTIWDGGGNDTFDASNQTAAVTIDLHPGAFSSIAGTNNIAIAFGAAIENAIGSSLGDTLTANEAGNTLKGMAGNDTLIGGGGADRLIGGTGVDTETGNGGADVFVFLAGDSSPATNSHDRITDFVRGTDLIDLTGLDGNTATANVIDAFRLLLTAAFDGVAAALNYTYDSTRGVTVLQGDVNGDRVADFAIDLTGNIALTSADFTTGSIVTNGPLNLTGDNNPNTLTGGSLNDTLSGLGAADTLYGNDGDDMLDGGTGADMMYGGKGDDTYLVDDPGDQVIENSGTTTTYTPPSGYTVKGTADLDGDGQLDVLLVSSTATRLQLIKNGVGQSLISMPAWSGWPATGFADLNGDGKKDILYQSGSQQYAVYLNGTSYTGEDYVSGKTADAILTLSGAGSNEGTDTVQSSITYTLPTGIENLTLTGSANINGTGNAVANIIIGNSGINILAGKAGADTLTGGGAADTFAFADGDTGAALGSRDLITDFTPGVDKLDIVNIDADTSKTGDDAFRFLGTAAFDGQAGALNYTFDSVRNVTVLAGDTNGDGTADFAIDLSGNKTLAESDFTTGSLAAAVIPGNVIGDGNANTLTGTGGNDSMYGYGANDTLYGNDGDDLLDGGTGADAMYGGKGNDTYVVDDPGDVVTENTGTAYTPPSGYTIKGTADFDGDGQLDVLLVSSTATKLQLIKNGVGQSLISMPAWSGWPAQGLADLNGDGKKDILYQSGSQQYAAYLNGTTQTGEGYVSGKTPDAIQTLSGGNEGTDQVQSSIAYTLPTGVENLTLTGSANINGTGNAVANVIVGNSGINILTGKAGADTLTGNGAADTFAFGDGDTGAALGSRDLITDFTPGLDKIDISAIDADSVQSGNNAFRFLGTAAFDGQAAALNYAFDSVRNVTVLTGYTNGDSVADFAIELTGNKTLAETDFASGSLVAPPADIIGDGNANTLNGTSANDKIYGLGANDTLYGYDADDLLDGGTGADTMYGGKGNDTYVVDDPGDQTIETAGPAYTPPSGYTVKGTADFDGDGQLDVLLVSSSATKLQLIKNGVGQSLISMPAWSGWPAQGLVDANGDGQKDILYQSGSTQYAVFLNGTTQTGEDYVTGKTPDTIQTLTGGNEGTDLVQSSITTTLATGVENLTLTGSSNINGTGNTAANAIIGNSGANVLNGLAGADTLTGNGGADKFAFGLPTDGIDTVTDFVRGTDLVQISASGFGHGLVAAGTPVVVNAASAAAATNAGSNGYFILDNSGASVGTLYWDGTGGSGSDATAIAVLQNITTLSAADFILV